MPQVVLSAGNIAHYHHTALALQEAGYLKQYFCVFDGVDDFGFLQMFLPSSWRKRLQSKSLPGLARHQITSVAWPYLGARFMQQLGLIRQEQASVQYGTWFDKVTKRKLPESDVFHFVNGIGLETARCAKARGCITICDIRAAHIDSEDAIFTEEYGRLGLEYQSLRRALRPRLLAEYAVADALIVPSRYVAETLQQHKIDIEKIHILPYGVNLSRFRLGETVDQRRRQDSLYRTLFVGRVNPGKGVHYLIEAFGRLQLPRSELLIVGRVEDTAYGRYLEKLIDQFKAKVTFLGHLPQTELWQVYKRSDLFVLPTLSEGSAMVIYEAMAAGLPVLTTDHAGAVVSDGKEGYIIPIRDAEALQEKMALLYESLDLRRTMGQRASQRVQAFSWEKYGQRLLAIYKAIWLQRGHR